MDNIMPQIRRVFNTILIPIPPRHNMHFIPPKRPPTPPTSAILNLTPGSPVRNLILSLPEVILHARTPTGPWDGSITVICIVGPPVPICLRSLLFPNYPDVDVGSLVCEDVAESPAVGPMGWFAWSLVFGPDPTEGWRLSHVDSRGGIVGCNGARRVSRLRVLGAGDWDLDIGSNQTTFIELM